MDEIKRQVSRARSRLILQQFVRVLTWTMFAALIVAFAGLAVPKVWALETASTRNGSLVWTWSWIGGALAAGLLAAVAITYYVRRKEMDAAIEIDRRFGLKERVSSALALHPGDLETDAGRALVSDASRRIQTINVVEQFSLRVNWRSLLPLLPAAAVFLLVFLVSDAKHEQTAAATESALEIEKRIKTSEEQFRKQLLGQRQKLEGDEDLQDLANLLKEIDEQLESNKQHTTRTSALLQLNDLKKNLEDFRRSLDDPNKLKDQLNRLKDINKGPADKAVKAMQQGDFDKAAEEMQELAEQLRSGEFNEQQHRELQDQIAGLQEQLNKHQRAKDELRQQIAQAEREGNGARKHKLQQELEELEQLDDEMQQAQELADQLSQVQQDLVNGNGQRAAGRLNELANKMQTMQDELDDLETKLQTLDQVMDQIAQAKNAMGCKQCDGGGCAACQGQGNVAAGGDGDGDEKGRPVNNATGKGPGGGFRPETETDTGFFESKVDAEVKQGTVVRIGEAGGANVAGPSREQAKAEIASDLRKDPDPLNEQPLPKHQRQHTKEYFELFRKANE